MVLYRVHDFDRPEKQDQDGYGLLLFEVKVKITMFNRVLFFSHHD
jgi:hypothetical protein